MAREIRYCTSDDGVRIAYCVEGQGPTLVQCPSLWESFENELDFVAVYQPLRRDRKVLRYDLRGVGLSQRDAASYSQKRMLADIEAVVAAAGLDRFDLMASTFSVGAAIAYAAAHPEQVNTLVVSRLIIRGVDVMPRASFDGLVGLLRGNWEMGSQAVSDLGIRSGDPTVGIKAAENLRQNMHASDLISMISDLYESVDVLGALPDVRCPTLILHRTNDTVFPFAAAQHAAATIPNARLMPLPGSGPVSLGGDAEQVVQAISDFQDEHSARADPEPPAPHSHGSVRTVLFTDLVGHTQMMQRLGDDAGRALLREHERITRETLARFDGREVKTMGDGFMASFTSVGRALDCAIELQRAFALHAQGAPEPLRVRVGLNAGEPIEEDGDLFGASVILASRIAAQAGPGEILIADPVRHLLAGKSYVYADRGQTQLKGFEDAVRLFEVRWQE